MSSRIEVPVGGAATITLIVQEVDDSARFADVERRAVELVRSSPDSLTKDDLARQLHVRKQEAVRVINRLLDEGVLAPRRRGALLHVVGVTDDDRSRNVTERSRADEPPSDVVDERSDGVNVLETLSSPARENGSRGRAGTSRLRDSLPARSSS